MYNRRLLELFKPNSEQAKVPTLTTNEFHVVKQKSCAGGTGMPATLYTLSNFEIRCDVSVYLRRVAIKQHVA